MIRAVLFDLDGVVRHFDPRNVASIEHRHGLAPGTIESFAFSSPLIEWVTTGRITRREWVAQVADRVGNRDAAEAWGRQPSRADPDVLALADELRAMRLTTAILTNGTDTIPAEARALGLHAHFDHIFNSASIGYAKPDERAFRHVLDALGMTGRHVFFTDDSRVKIVGAAALGMPTHHYTDIRGLRDALRDAGIDVDA